MEIERYLGPEPDFLREYCQAPELRRLAGVGMNCGCEYTRFPLFRRLAPYSRLDHSLGCARIVWRFTGDKTQTLSALFHDMATPAFAHTIDFLRGDHLTQEATEAGTAGLLAASPVIASLLRRDGIPMKAVEDYHRYPLADNPSPRLSADRLEYTLGNLENFGLRSTGELRAYYADLRVMENEFGEPELCFRTPDAAVSFARDALRCSRVYVSDEDRYSMQRLAEVVGRALRVGALTEGDLMTTEAEVISKLVSHPGTEKMWREFRALSRLERDEALAPPELRRVIPAKKRCIDPLCPPHGRASHISPEFRAELDAFLAQSQDGWVCAV